MMKSKNTIYNNLKISVIAEFFYVKFFIFF